jgi:hypothetical protein
VRQLISLFSLNRKHCRINKRCIFLWTS